MPGEWSVLKLLQALHAALRQEREVAERLLHTTQGVRAVLDDEDASDDVFNEALEAQGAALSATREAEENTQQARLRLKQRVSLGSWRMSEIEDQVLQVVSAEERPAATAGLAEIKAVVTQYADILRQLQPLTETVETQLRHGLRTVGENARTMSRGRQVTQAYASVGGQAAARFIDKRE